MIGRYGTTEDRWQAVFYWKGRFRIAPHSLYH